MREKLFFIYERDFMFCLAGQLYAQAPNRQPRKAETIMKKALDAFRDSDSIVFDNGLNYISLPEKDVYKFIDKLLKNIPEFCELNLSQIEFESGVSVNDENRPSFAFVSLYDKYTKEQWKHDFVDLDAFVRNVCDKIFIMHDLDKDCFLCSYQPEDSESTLSPGSNIKCDTCTVNPKHTCNYACKRYAKGKYTLVCNYNCYKNKYICCSECDDKDGCKHRCDSTPDKCNNKM